MSKNFFAERIIYYTLTTSENEHDVLTRDSLQTSIQRGIKILQNKYASQSVVQNIDEIVMSIRLDPRSFVCMRLQMKSPL